ncbi:cytochrome c [Immundisolibacter sp.]|uniref:c-type cytochrome n=1 Tax=Immundisolibacter sp. TaxID=1934948 RepID=UPI00262EAA05|nr:cytochrome c [Immundisolibacter sp.]MDD3652369.1 cytochrome c [Immundisolibacter sp.]
MKKTTQRRLATVGALLTLTSAVALAAPFSDETMARARRDYNKYCASCHGPEGHGDGPVAQSMKAMPADITVLSQKNNGEFPTERVRDIIDGRADVKAHGPRTMPVWGEELYVSPEGVSQRQAQDRIAALTEYVRRMQK